MSEFDLELIHIDAFLRSRTTCHRTRATCQVSGIAVVPFFSLFALFLGLGPNVSRARTNLFIGRFLDVGLRHAGSPQKI